MRDSSVVSISLSSGFSFQVPYPLQYHRPPSFQSRYRAASHFRKPTRINTLIIICFNLVIERLLISGERDIQLINTLLNVSISLSSGFSFQASPHDNLTTQALSRFNLVIERLLISGMSNFDNIDTQFGTFQSRYRAASHFRQLCWGAVLN